MSEVISTSYAVKRVAYFFRKFSLESFYIPKNSIIFVPES